jgi:superfamily II DNA or RNA helicase
MTKIIKVLKNNENTKPLKKKIKVLKNNENTKPLKKKIKVLKNNENTKLLNKNVKPLKKVIKVIKVLKNNENITSLKKVIKVLKNNEDTKLLNKNNSIEPSEWILPNKKKFINWVNKIFINYQLKGKYDEETGFKLLPNQKFIRDYMQHSSPYRGILLYHGLGSGKTCSAIAVAENLKNYVDNIVIMLPASIKQNFIHELKFCGDDKYKSNPKLIDNYYKFVSYNSSTKIKQLDKLNSLDNSVIIIDEIHNLVSLIMNSMINKKSNQGYEIYKKIMEAKNIKLIFLSGTPIINNIYETAIMFNMLKGYIEIIKFQMSDMDGNYLNIETLEKINKEFVKIPEFDFIDQYYPINNNLHLCLKINSSNQNFGDIIDSIINIGINNNIIIKYIDIDESNTLFPENKKDFENFFITLNKDNTETFKNKDLYKRRILGLVSYLKGSNEFDYPKINNIHNIKVNMSDYQYNLYEIIREHVERKQERYSKKNKQMNSVFRVYSRQISNFIFPEDIIRPYPKKILQIFKSLQNNGNNKAVIKISNDEFNNNANDELLDKVSKKQMLKIDEILNKLDNNSSQYLTIDKLHKYSPKMLEIMNNINNSNGLILIYSQFRKMEGVGVFSKVLNANGYSYYNKNNKLPKYAIYSGMEKEDEKIDIINKFTHPNNKYGDNIKILMITMAGAEGLDLKNIRQVHILEPYWNEVKIQQVIGRARRRKSHIDLPPKDRNIDIFRYYSSFSNTQLKSTKEYIKITTDEFIYQLARKKKIITDEILNIFKEIAVDCTLNSFETNNNIQCYSFGDISNGLSSKPNIKEDIGFIKHKEEIRTFKINLQKAIIDNNGFVLIPNNKDKKFYKFINNKLQKPLNLTKSQYSNYKIVVIDLNSNNIYDYYASIKHNQIKIGIINKDGLFVKF